MKQPILMLIFQTMMPLYKITVENFAARLKQANFATKADIANFVKRQVLRKN